MSARSLTRWERSDLCDLMVELGPEAPTLNEGWSVIDLAAHLVVREHDLWAAAGIRVEPLGFLVEMAMRRRREQGLESLVNEMRAGEPLWFRPVPAVAQLYEFFIHHEDVRRANGLDPRTDRPDLDETLARILRLGGRILTQRIEVGLDIVWQGGVLYRHGPEPRAVVSGPPGELLLYLTGRKEAARVTLHGDRDAIRVLDDSDLSI